MKKEKHKFVIITPSPTDPAVQTEVMYLKDMADLDWLMMDVGEKYSFKVVERTEAWFNKFPEL